MKRFLSVALAVALVALLAGVAFAQMGRGPMAPGMGRGMMMGPGTMGGGMGPANCPGTAAGSQQTPAAQVQVTEEKAKELAQQYADQYLKGFTVEKVLPFTMPHGTGYSVELKGPKDEVRTFHINPWGNVMPFGGPWRRAG